jgi:hypothetical protein
MAWRGKILFGAFSLWRIFFFLDSRETILHARVHHFACKCMAGRGKILFGATFFSLAHFSFLLPLLFSLFCWLYSLTCCAQTKCFHLNSYTEGNNDGIV